MDTNKFTIPIAIIIAGLIVGGSIYLSSKKTAEPTKNNLLLTTGPEASRPVTSDDHILGNPNADIVIVEYSDTECPYCKEFHKTLNQLVAEYGPSGKVAWVYRHFPIDGLHPKARKEAEATECAREIGGNNKFWEYTNAIYDRTPSNNGLPVEELPKIASDIDLPLDTFNQCLQSGKFADKVEADYQEAVRTGGRGTPHSILVIKSTGEKIPVEGALPYTNLKQAIDSILAQ